MSKQDNDKWLIDNTANEQAAVELEELANAVSGRWEEAKAKTEELRKSLEKDGLL